MYVQGTDKREAAPEAATTMGWVAVVVGGGGFNPERYEALLRTMVELYATTGSPPKLLECFLSVQIKGRYGQAYVAADHDPRKALLVSNVKDLISAFGLEFILVWTALLMKKRIAVYGASVGDVLEAVRGLPVLVWHRQDWGLLRPWVTLDDEQLHDLRTAGVYVAGFTDPGVRALPDLYDLLIDLDNRAIRLMDHAAPDFKLGAFHKDLATYLVQAAADPDVSTQALIKARFLPFLPFLSVTQSLIHSHVGRAPRAGAGRAYEGPPDQAGRPARGARGRQQVHHPRGALRLPLDPPSSSQARPTTSQAFVSHWRIHEC